MSASVVRHGVFLDGRSCFAVWQALRGIERLSPAAAEAKDALRLAASAHIAEQQQAMSAGGHSGRTSADLTGSSEHDRSTGYATASDLASRLRVTPRHIRRLAAQHDVQPARKRPYAWSTAGAAAIADLVQPR